MDSNGNKIDETDIKIEPDIVTTAVATSTGAAATSSSEPAIPAGHSRFYCNKCHTPYDLPDRATSWRCSKCLTFNSITQGECEWCTVL